MAHLVETMAYAGEVPWHGLGNSVPSDLSPKQMLEAAEIDWTVEKIPAFIEIDGVRKSVGHSALVRSTDNSILDIVTNDWHPMQNADAFEFFHEYCAVGDMQMHTAGSLRGGQIVWCLAKVNESFDLFGGDQVDSFLLFTNPHRFGQSIDVRFTPIRVVCNNTLTLSLSMSSDRVIKANHRSEFDAKHVKEQLGIATDKLQRYKEMAQFLGSKRYNDSTLKEYFTRIFPSLSTKEEQEESTMSRNARLAMGVVESQPGAKFAEGSWWQAFNAVTYLTDHKIGRTVDSRLASAWYGPNKNLKVKALETAVEFAEAA
jgi:phage/plasmid-like protein (TIGR03299 family)